jgi:hypothetical protein
VPLSDPIIAGLIAAGILSDAAALDRQLVADSVAKIIKDFVTRDARTSKSRLI